MSSHLNLASEQFSNATPGPVEAARLSREIASLGDWFHNIDLNGVWTAPNHFLGDFPNIKWRHIEPEIPKDLTGATVLDVGCNGGFYSIQMKKRGAERVLGIDIDDRYLAQGRFAAKTLGLEIEFEKRSVYEVDELEGQFDYVVFMGVLYHLRYPLYALDKVVKKVGGKLIFQTMCRGSEASPEFEKNYDFWNKQIFELEDWPRMYFVEHSYANDPTNWWIPNCPAAEAMLRSAGLTIVSHPETEIWICEASNATRDGTYVHELELEGTL